MEEEENRGWKERHFFSLNMNPAEAMRDPDSYLINPKTNPARYDDPETEQEPEPETPANPEDKQPGPPQISTNPAAYG